MGRPLRSEQFVDNEICVVHCYHRCVRRAFLTGFDSATGVNYSFRRETMRRRMEALVSVFGVEVLCYSLMGNHFHVILRNRPDVVATWSDHDVAVRWLRVFPGKRLGEFLGDPTESAVEALLSQPEKLARCRRHLSDISWFMRALSECIARIANAQDKCTGAFWDGRFHAKRLSDDAAMLACAIYVDLNPERAGSAASIEEAEFTSAYDRLRAEVGEMIDSAAFNLKPITNKQAGQERRETPLDELKQKEQEKKRNPTGRRILRDAWLAPLQLKPDVLASDPEVHTGGTRVSDKGFLNMSLNDYLELLRWTLQQGIAEAQREIPPYLASILSNLGLDPTMWHDMVWNFKKYFGCTTCLGSPESMAADAERAGKRYHRGQGKARAFFSTA